MQEKTAKDDVLRTISKRILQKNQRKNKRHEKLSGTVGTQKPRIYKAFTIEGTEKNSKYASSWKEMFQEFILGLNLTHK